MKKIILSAAIMFTAVSVFSQEKAIKENGFWNNWFIQGQIGGSYMFSENTRDAKFGDLLNPAASVSVGKFFSPIAGARINATGWQARSWVKATDTYYKNEYVQGSVDGLLSLTNLFLPYNPDRGFNLIGILGVGYAHGFKKEKAGVPETNMIVPRAGLAVDFRFTNKLSFNLETNANLLRDNFNGQEGGDSYDIPVNVMVGLAYRLGKSGFEKVDVVDPTVINSLNSKINQQLSQLNEKDRLIESYKTQLANKPEPTKIITEVVKEDTEVLMNAVVVFKLGSAKLEHNQDINVYNAAKYLQENQKVQVTVTGYADKSTGTAAVNQRLSEQRAQAVADILTKTYNISPDRITVRASGDKEQPFAKDEWNRVVIFTAR
ncbi:OmpA family protein [Dysgonomonas sp. 520]|uniref:OmpA family protein n=1 Tax=Dysgonomonas sp. 520 TaxID=2302931 RepID=UPI0013D0CF89|nr:OmpA family protein [Dysgonomonas sp. 520]NDW09216.1 OmpA family protein [Dysgonomonas sp. 520]